MMSVSSFLKIDGIRGVMRLLSVLIFSLAISARIQGQEYSIDTFAGGALPENLAGGQARLGAVSGVTRDKSGNVYLSIADPYNIVLRLDLSGNLTRVAGNGGRGFDGDGGPATAAELYNPAGLATDGSGSLYVADAGNNLIRKVTGGVITTVAGGWGGMCGITFQPSVLVWISRQVSLSTLEGLFTLQNTAVTESGPSRMA